MLGTSLIIIYGLLGALLISKVPLLQPFSYESKARASAVQEIIEKFFGRGQYMVWTGLFLLRYLVFNVVNSISLEVIFKVMKLF